MHLMWYDWVMVAVLVFGTIRGAAKGLVWQVAAIAAILLCFAFAESLSLSIAPLLPVEAPLNRWVAMFLLYVGFSFLTFAAARQLSGWIEKMKLQEYDRHLGAIFGFVKGLTFCLVITFFVVTLSENMRGAVFESQSGKAAAIIMDRLHPVMPNELHDVIGPYIHRLDHPDLDLRHRHTHDIASNDEHDHDGHDHDGLDHSGHDHDGHDHGHSHGNTTSSESNGEGEGVFDEIISKLPGFLNSELRQLVRRALKNTRPEDRDELIGKVNSGIPGLVRRNALDWEHGKPDAFGSDPRPAAGDQQRLLREIAAIHYDFPDSQNEFIEEIETALADLPGPVAGNVLKDWNADLTETDPDPDPQTDYTTSLNTRIVRQLEAANVPLSSLSRGLQDQLRGAQIR